MALSYSARTVVGTLCLAMIERACADYEFLTLVFYRKARIAHLSYNNLRILVIRSKFESN